MPHARFNKHFGGDFASRLVGLAIACPVEQNNPTDCPLHDIRLLTLQERLNWVKSCTRKEAEGIFRQHSSCHRYQKQ